MGMLAAGVSVWMTTNSWVSFPWLVTKKVTLPAGAEATDRWMNIWVGEVSPSPATTMSALAAPGPVEATGDAFGRGASVLKPPAVLAPVELVQPARDSRAATAARTKGRPRAAPMAVSLPGG